MADAASDGPRRSALARLLWMTWLIGPASYGIAFFLYVVAPEIYYGTPDPGPDLLLACIMMLTHLAAATCTFLLLIARGPHWRSVEFWILLVYWGGIAGWLMPALWVTDGPGTIDPTLPWFCTRLSVVAVVLMPVMGLARRIKYRGPSGRPG